MPWALTVPCGMKHIVLSRRNKAQERGNDTMRAKMIFQCLALSLWTLPALAQPGTAQVAAGCAQAPSMEFGLGFTTATIDPVVGRPITVSATTPTLVLKNVGGPRCEGARRIPLKNWIWTLDVPAGSQSQLANTETLNVSFTPDKEGTYTVHLNGCGNQCTVRVFTGDVD